MVEVNNKNKKIEVLGGDLQKSIALLQSDLYLETLPAAFAQVDEKNSSVRHVEWSDSVDDDVTSDVEEGVSPDGVSESKGLGGIIKEKLSHVWNSTAQFFTKNITDRATKLLTLADETADDLFRIFIMFCLTTIIIPLMMIILMKAVFNSIMNDYQHEKSLFDVEFIKNLLSTKKERAEKEGRKICPYCKYTTAANYDGKVCPNCGRKFELRCPNPLCNEIIREGFLAKFCSSCGEKLTRCPECSVIQSDNAVNCSECGAEIKKER